MAESKGMSRRNFITGAAVASAMAGLGLAGCAPKSGAEGGAESNGANTAWDEECEVLIVGSGYTGLAAALEAKSAGADVKVIEKMPLVGGNSALAAGDMAVYGSSVQKREGIEDSVDAYVHDMMVAGLFLNDEAKCRVIAEKSNETWEWTKEMGATWDKDENGEPYLYPYGGHSIMRTICQSMDGGGSNVTKPFAAKLEEMGVEVETGRMLVALVTDESGRVIGATVHDGAKDNNPESGKPVNIKASKAVVLASGGYGRDVEFRSAQDPRLGEDVDCTNQEGATAEVLRAAVAAGAMAVHTDWIQLLPFMSPDETGYGIAAFYTDAQASYSPTLSVATGKRVVSELTDRKRYADAILETGQPCVQLSCQKSLYKTADLEGAMKAGIVTEFQSIEEAAEHYGMPVDAVKEEIERYNGFIKNGVDEDFGKEFPEGTPTLDEAPFYGVRLWPKVHHCMGGVKTDVDCRVLDMNLEVIPGLYAAGEAAGGIHGACRLGSCATADCLVNGRIAGQKAAAEAGA